ncbi:MAG: (2Fe-2S)-binding protein [Dethiobacter sp.]|jgi:predicted molibdopterin-dependent oxidoreductase YjgC|nr:(2Fe-2S)-binding protein [Dethiobacter sp.]
MRIEEHPVLSFQRGKKVTFTYDGVAMDGYENETVAAALHAAGIKILGYSPAKHRPRGFFCAVGKCSSCFMTVNGVPNVRTCVTKLREDMKVETQIGKGELF